MSKVRVYEVARELGLENRELIQRIAALGIQVRNHMSVLETAEVDQLKRALEKERVGETVETKIRPTVTRRRVRKKKKKVEPVAAAPERQSAAPRVERSPAVRPPVESRPAQRQTPHPTAEVAAPAAAIVESVERVPASMPPKPSEDDASVVDAAGELSKPADAAVDDVAADTPASTPTESAMPEEAVASSPETSESSDPSEVSEDIDSAIPDAPVTAVSETTGPAPSKKSKKSKKRDRPARQPVSRLVAAAETAAPTIERRTEPPPLEERFGHAPLPPGVTRRGNTNAPSAGARLSEEQRQKIVATHAAQRPARRQIRHRASIGPAARPQSRGRRRKEPGRKPRQTVITVPSAAKRRIRIEGQVTLQVLAQRMSLKATDLLMKLMQLGVGGVHINSTLDADTATLIADEFGYEVENVELSQEELVGDARGEFENLESDQVIRAPIITIMGHVDHGKTSLLDKIRSARVAAGEAGGITQHISAFRVDTKKGPVVFLDTPGHEAFTAMRARGAQATDVVVLVTAADDGVMPQTREAVNHSQSANVPIIVAVNKIDRPDASSDRVKNELAILGLQPEEWGGDTLFVETSAITGQGIEELLESISLTAELLELQSNPKIPAEGIVLEARVDRGRGVVANVLIRDGKLSTGDYVVAGGTWGRVKAMTDCQGKQQKTVGPATPIELLGLGAMPSSGDMVYKVTDAKKAQEVAAITAQKNKVPTAANLHGLDQLQKFLKSGEQEELQLVVKADVQGSLEAIRKSLEDLSTDQVRVKLIHTGVGGITENDVMLANASNGIIIGFNVRPQGKASAVAKKSGVEIRNYSVIYEAIDDVKAAMAGLLSPKLVEKDVGQAEIRETFVIPKIGAIAGCMVTSGKMLRAGEARLVRDGVVVWTGKMGSLRRFKENVADVANGFECGIGLAGFNDIKEGDIIECFEIEEVAATLE